MLKKIFLISLFSLFSFSVFSDEPIITEANNPVIGLIGASFIDPESAYGNGLGLTALNGSSYRGLADYLKARTINNINGMVFREAAQGGATSSGALGFDSALTQAVKLYEHSTMWADGSHLKVVIIDIFNDCLHNSYGPLCTEEDIQNGLVFHVTEAIQYLQARNVKVFVNRLVDYDSLDLPLAEEVFKIINPNFTVATREQYELLVSTYENSIAQIEGVEFLNTWKRFRHFGDGLHPSHRTKKRAAKYIVRKLKRYLDY
ncbi:hypothetical protein [Aliikangiella sp. IMCC44359]|uniref:hypothetical protein n=1 Tax=Aliikangiella sp. IMCC44359 TaxID=3459125 RepID=UPI00403B2AF5